MTSPLASLPALGTGVLEVLLVACALSFALSVAAARGRPRLLESARLAVYATCGLSCFAVLLLAYGFFSHDFRLLYVAEHSDRATPWQFLLGGLWGGQDGSLLWWLFLLALYIAACVRWLRGRYVQLQPIVLATLMVTMAFFVVTMLWSANPFATGLLAAPANGKELNPLLQNYWMMLHPPALYLGFVGCTIPFAFAVAALVTGRVDSEWIVGVRKWMLFAWLFLTIGNVLGMIWSYEELGWGGYWAWDPVENAACVPWFTASAYVHSTMIQERRNTLKVWNVVLIALTFFLTIYGTFLTRAGIISSIHAFAASDIGAYFVGFMVLIVATVVGLIAWRWPLLRSDARLESLASREAAFVANNWALVGIAAFITVATLFPKLSALFYEQEITLGPRFFNRWVAPGGIIIFALMGLGPLFGWRKTSRSAFLGALLWPAVALVVTAGLHLALGARLGYPALVTADPSGRDLASRALDAFAGVAPVLVTSLAAFNLVVIAQEFARGVRARRRAKPESIPTALVLLVAKNRRRYGGYIVHLGVVACFVGFAGKAWETSKELSLSPGESARVGDYAVTYRDARREVDPKKTMVFAELDVASVGSNGEETPLAKLEPARFVYPGMGQNTAEASVLRSLTDDFYGAVLVIDPSTKRATFSLHVNPLVTWIWVGTLLMILGSAVSLWPEGRLRQLGVWGFVRLTAGGATALAVTLLLATAPARVFARENATEALGRRAVPAESAATRLLPEAP